MLLNKPKDFITTTSDDRGRKTVMQLVDNACDERIYPVGRLDRNTTGLLLFTNDGDLAKKLIHPKHGVRKIYHVTLDKKLAKLVRYAAKSIAMGESYESKLDKDSIVEILGANRYNKDKYQNNDVAGVVTGLAWTSVGGSILFIESSLSPGKGKLTLTGNLGKVMKESASLALEFIKSNYDKFELNPEVFNKWDVHIHVPEGAVPKDGPSAGVTMLTSLVSLFLQKKVKKSLAMSGEITLRGKVLPVGGIKEKILAAKRAGIKEIILCKENEKDVLEIKAEYLKGLTFNSVSYTHLTLPTKA